VIVLLGIGFLAGVVTAVSPCVLPVLPILLAGGASGRKPYRIIAGLVVSFTVFTLFAAWILDQLGLPDDFLRNLAIALLFLVALTLLVPQVAELVERPLARFSRLRPRDTGGGFFFGATIGLVFVPCAGPVLSALTVVAATSDVGGRAIALMLAYALGAAVPMLAVTLGGRGAAQRLRAHAAQVRTVSGIAIAAVAIGLVFHADDNLATFVPGYTSFFQSKIEENGTARRELAKLRDSGGSPLTAKPTSDKEDALPDYGEAPNFHPAGDWFNSKPLTVAGLRGKVVLVDFWTYSCVNCLRTLPHLEAWDAAYRKRGLVIVGVHTPEFAFEHVASNVGAAIERLGIEYPVFQDNDFETWNAYANQYWPAEYLIDRTGHVRHAHFGEGEYGETENLIRRLLSFHGARAQPERDTTPQHLMTPESYLGYERLDRYAGSKIESGKEATYAMPVELPQNALAYGGRWRVEGERIVAGRNARLRLHFVAQNVYLVLGGRGTVNVLVDGKPQKTVRVDAYKLYTLRAGEKVDDALLELRFSPGVRAYAFTFG
jgi:cytochrome c biogenesis protein CcdA/thiol-disulfide isomerase/thioredoxin